MMIAKYFFEILFIGMFFSCENVQNKNENISFPNFTEGKGLNPFELINPKGPTVKSRIDPPQGFERKHYPENSFQSYLRNFPLQPDTSPVLYYNGKIKNKNIHAAVLDTDVGQKDLQQCADAVMRLRAEYLFREKRFSEIHFNFTNRFIADYTKWAEGYRIQVKGNNIRWVKTSNPDYSYENFKKYIFFVYIYAGTLSLSDEMKTKKYEDMDIGDVFIMGGSPGHAMIIMDMAVNPENQKKVYLLAQSYMPAQSIHIVKNLNNSQISPWYELDLNTENIYTPEWTFTPTDLKHF